MEAQEKDPRNVDLNNESSDINTDSENHSESAENTENSQNTENIDKPKPKKKRGLKFSSAKEDELQEKVDSLTEKNAELNDKYLRLYSEFDNYRKRTIKEKAELFKTAAEDTILAVLPVVDDFERALKSFKSSEEDNAHKAGMELIYNKLVGIMKNRGVESIHESGVAFDLDIHEAITKIPAPTDELKGKVVDVVEKGYTLGGKVIRFAKVVIGE